MMVAYADSIVLILSGKTEEIFETEVNTQLQRIGRQMREIKVEVAPAKTNAVVQNSKIANKDDLSWSKA